MLYLDDVIDVSDIDISPYEIQYTYGGNKLYGIEATRYIVRDNRLHSTASTVGSLEFTYKENGNVATVKFSYHPAWKEDFVKGIIASYDEAMSLIKPGDSDFAKALKLHDWIVKNVSYGMSKAYSDFAVGALANRSAVCGGYAQCYQFLLSQVGVDSIYVAAKVSNGEHAWNLVKIEGHWFHVDCTWDRSMDGSNRVKHTYFMLNDDEFNADGTHTEDWKNHGYPINNQCSIENKYYSSNTDIATDEQIATNLIKIKHVYDDSTNYNSSSTEHWRVCKAGINVYEKHDGNPCNICQYQSENTCNHQWIDNHDDNYHWQECSICNEKINIENHNPTNSWKSDESSHWTVCTKCGDVKLNVVKHTWIQESNQTEHWKKCSICGYETSKEIHNGNPCYVCHYESSHHWINNHDDNYHWQECDICNEKKNIENHSPTNNWESDGSNHWHLCRQCSDIKLDTQGHTWLQRSNQTYHWKECQVCGYQTTKEVHNGNPCKECNYTVISNDEKKDHARVSYQTHIQTYGWQNSVYDGKTSGTTGQSKRLEAIKLTLQDTKYAGHIQYRTHIQTYGWEKGWKSDGEISGTSGESKRLEAIQIQLTGELANHYDIYYRVHAQHFGWLDWAKNGESAGTATYGYRLEAIQVKLVKKGEAAPGPTSTPFHQRYISYQTHVQTYGWQSGKYDGEISGTTGQAKRLEGIKISLPSQPYSGSIQYRTHIQTYGWENGWKANGEMSGTSGQSKRLEAIQIQLTGEMANHYDIYYRVHAQKFGWLGWTKNGESAGTAGYAYRLEGIQIVLVSKGGKAPGSTSSSFYSR